MLTRFARISIVGPATLIGLVLSARTPCFAQFGTGPGGIGGDSASELGGAAQRTLRGAQQAPQKGTVAQPPVLPGTKAAPEAAAPNRSPSDMTPTEALFDAINRGDIAAARDAVNRGGDLHAQNILGMTPLEASVDLGRNDISFMLLSLGDEGVPVSGIANTGRELRGAERTFEAPPAHAASRANYSRPAATARSVGYSEGDSLSAAGSYVGYGGMAIPSVGFLGFEQGRAGR